MANGDDGYSEVGGGSVAWKVDVKDGNVVRTIPKPSRQIRVMWAVRNVDVPKRELRPLTTKAVPTPGPKNQKNKSQKK